jgi:DNA polymerase I-like protein with 3'-5' exonuclease and polymerase domains
MVPIELKYLYDKLKIRSATVPKIDEEILKHLPYEECKPLAKFQMLQKRCAMIAEGKQAWLRCYNEETNRIHGAINQFGTVTGRCNHFKPNLGQVTAPRSPYGKECRSLFIVPKGWHLVGCDADGLEARCKAHYITPFDGGEFVKCILEGKKKDATDIHSLNRDRLGMASRDVAKTWYYAFMYGSGNENLGRIAMEDDNYKDYTGDLKKLGSKHRGKLSKEFKGLKELIDAVQAKCKQRGNKMWLRGLDGRKIPVRAVYSSLNTLLQSAGAVIMKKAMVIAEELILSQGLVPVKDYVQILFVHDELQYECRTKDIAEIVAECVAHSIALAGEHFKLRCPLAGSSKIGKTWLDTH